MVTQDRGEAADSRESVDIDECAEDFGHYRLSNDSIVCGTSVITAQLMITITASEDREGVEP